MGKGSGRGSKERAREKRLAKKRAKKQAMREKWAAMRAAGANKKSKRFLARQKAQRKNTPRSSHPEGACGNIGCMKCSFIYQPGQPLHWIKQLHEKNKRETQEAQRVNER